MRTPLRALLGSLIVVGASLGALGLLSGCTSPRNVLGTRTSICYLVLPEARAAVGNQPAFAGVRYLPAAQLVADVRRARRQGIAVPDPLADAARRPMCLVSYRGLFDPGAVEKAWAPLPGPYLFAVVVMRQDTRSLVGTILFHKVPLRFTHIFAFEH